MCAPRTTIYLQVYTEWITLLLYSCTYPSKVISCTVENKQLTICTRTVYSVVQLGLNPVHDISKPYLHLNCKVFIDCPLQRSHSKWGKTVHMHSALQQEMESIPHSHLCAALCTEQRRQKQKAKTTNDDHYCKENLFFFGWKLVVACTHEVVYTKKTKTTGVKIPRVQPDLFAWQSMFFINGQY